MSGLMEPPSAWSHSGRLASASRSSAARWAPREVLLGDLSVDMRLEPGAPASLAADELLGGLPPGANSTLDVVVQRRPLLVPARDADEVYGPLRLWRSGDHLVVDGGGALVATVDSTGLTVGGDVSADVALPALRRVLHHGLSHLLALAGRAAVHGAGIARDGVGVLLLGPTGAGKSTAAYAGTTDGWRLLSDDLILLRAGEQATTMTGLHRSPTIPADVFTERGRTVAGDLRGRVAAELPQQVEPEDVAAVVLVEHGDDGGVEALPSSQVATLVFSSFPALGYPPLARRALGLAGALAALPGYRLALPVRAEGRVRAVRAFLDRIGQ